jgi:hypothetical protein
MTATTPNNTVKNAKTPFSCSTALRTTDFVSLCTPVLIGCNRKETPIAKQKNNAGNTAVSATTLNQSPDRFQAPTAAANTPMDVSDGDASKKARSNGTMCAVSDGTAKVIVKKRTAVAIAMEMTKPKQSTEPSNTRLPVCVISSNINLVTENEMVFVTDLLPVALPTSRQEVRWAAAIPRSPAAPLHAGVRACGVPRDKCPARYPVPGGRR